MKHKQMMDQGLFDLVLGRIQKTFGKKFEVENVASNTSIMIANIHNLFPIEATEHEVVLNNNDELEEDVNVSVTVYRLNSSCESQEIFLQVTIQTEDIEGYIYHHYSFEQVQKEIEDTIDGNTCYVYNPVAEQSSDSIEEPKMYSGFKWLPNILTKEELLEELNDFAEKSTGYVVLEEILPNGSCFRIVRLKDHAIKLEKPFNVEKTVNTEGIWLSAIINKCGFSSLDNSYYIFAYWKHEVLNQGTSSYIIYNITEEVYKTLTWKLYEILESVEHGNENAKKDFYNNLLVEFNLYNRDFVSNPFVTKSEYFTENDKVISFTPDPEEIEFMKQAVVDSEDTPNAEPPLIASVEIPGGLKDELAELTSETASFGPLLDNSNEEECELRKQRVKKLLELLNDKFKAGARCFVILTDSVDYKTYYYCEVDDVVDEAFFESAGYSYISFYATRTYILNLPKNSSKHYHSMDYNPGGFRHISPFESEISVIIPEELDKARCLHGKFYHAHREYRHLLEQFLTQFKRSLNHFNYEEEVNLAEFLKPEKDENPN